MTERSKEEPTRSAAAFAFCSLRAASTTGNPALANTSAIPPAIVPDPTTPTEATGRPAVRGAAGSGVRPSVTVSALPGAA